MEDIFFISSCMNDFSDGSAWWAPLYVNGIGLHIITYGAATYIEVHISNVVDGPHRCRKPRLAHSLLSFGWIPERGWNSRVTESTFSPPFFTLAQNGNRQVSYNGHHLQQGTAAGHHINDTLLGWTDYWVITPYHPCMLWVYVIIAESKETNHSTTLEWLVSGQHFNSFILMTQLVEVQRCLLNWF